MDYRAQLSALVERYTEATGRSAARVGTIILNQSSFFLRIGDGGSCSVDTYLKVKRWFADNWPDQISWPDDVDRPDVLPDSTRSARSAGRSAPPPSQTS